MFKYSYNYRNPSSPPFCRRGEISKITANPSPFAKGDRGGFWEIAFPWKLNVQCGILLLCAPSHRLENNVWVFPIRLLPLHFKTGIVMNNRVRYSAKKNQDG